MHFPPSLPANLELAPKEGWQAWRVTYAVNSSGSVTLRRCLMRPIAYRNYLLAVLTVIFTFNFADRFALGLVLDNIKVDLRLSDTELGLLSGIAFALFYSVMGIPIARWADRGNRVTVIALTAAVWSVMVGLCGMATNFVQLMLIRIGVGVGEAGCIPPAQALIADYFTREELPRATAIYWQGANLSLIIAYFVAGWLNEFYGWRMMFILVGLPGLALAVLARLTLKEPRSVRAAAALAVPAVACLPVPHGIAEMRPSPTWKDVCVALWVNITYRHLLYGFSVFYFFTYGIMQWQPTFLVRSFGLQTGKLGTWLALVYVLPAILSMHLGGEWASRHARGNERLQLRAMAIANGVSVVWAMTYFSHTCSAAFAWMALTVFLNGAITGPMYAMPQTVVPARMRATAIAIIFLFANLIGMGLGPLAVGIISDALRPQFGQGSLRYALLLFSPGYLWVSWHLWAASKTVMRDIAMVKADCEDTPRSGGRLAVTPVLD
jgi:MFS family permease